MSIRTFVAGAICGAAAFAAVDWLVPDRADSPPYEPEKASTTPAAPESTADHKPPGGCRITRPDSIQAPASTDTQDSGVDLPARLTDSGADSESDLVRQDSVPRDPSYWIAQRREELRQEPKDDSWAYYMEQTLLQYLARHTLATEFDIAYIECRTITCQIQVTGMDASANPTWMRIMYDLGQQLPDETTEWGSTGYDVGGRLVIVQTLKRKQPSP